VPVTFGRVCGKKLRSLLLIHHAEGTHAAACILKWTGQQRPPNVWGGPGRQGLKGNDLAGGDPLSDKLRSAANARPAGWKLAFLDCGRNPPWIADEKTIGGLRKRRAQRAEQGR